jgi:hypothetical protein
VLDSSYALADAIPSRRSSRPRNRRDARDRWAWELFGALTSAARLGRYEKARGFQYELAEAGYVIEAIDATGGLRMIPPADGRMA